MPKIRGYSLIVLTSAVQCCIFLTACTGQVSTSNINKSDLNVSTGSSTISPNNQELSTATYAMEGAISEDCLKAWRTATAGDCKGALKQLEKLQQKYPKSTTISFMKGQVLERSGDKKAAIKYYREGIRDNEYSSIQRFKLAEALRTTGDTAAATQEYRQLIKESPQFLYARIGLAKTLQAKAPQSVEAMEQLNEILKLDPENREALAMLKKSPKAPE
jgi:tetratricopeptide (TPR) repeat protein